MTFKSFHLNLASIYWTHSDSTPLKIVIAVQDLQVFLVPGTHYLPTLDICKI